VAIVYKTPPRYARHLYTPPAVIWNKLTRWRGAVKHGKEVRVRLLPLTGRYKAIKCISPCSQQRLVSGGCVATNSCVVKALIHQAYTHRPRFLDASAVRNFSLRGQTSKVTKAKTQAACGCLRLTRPDKKGRGRGHGGNSFDKPLEPDDPHRTPEKSGILVHRPSLERPASLPP